MLGNYRIRERIGAGGMGVVYSAVDTRTARAVALKVLNPSLADDQVAVGRFTREARLAARVRHANVVSVVAAGREGAVHFIAMELVEGQNLRQTCEERPMAAVAALAVTRQVAAALAAMQQSGILHRDVKPENVILDHNNVAKITDFGIARETVAAGRITDSGLGVGSLIYASPEQMRGHGDHRADIYSLGCTLYYMVHGRDPFPGHLSLDEMYRRKTARSPRIDAMSATVPTGVRSLILSMLKPKPRRRVQSYADILTSIDNMLARRSSPRRAWVFAAVVAGAFAWRI
ncbi:MAG: hypothetical protein A2341_04145 [Deltaproteobacteria bacterium RIFOXYB12_FULL_58_9]|nr:MAG: hypothetical protein A2341_04145 [Deltaproteobacteria bacterium RIFOXYB12_FULL_58_9]